MIISIILLGRTISGFNYLVDSVSKEFRAQLSTKFMDFPITRSFRSERKQYDANALLRELSRFAGEGEITVFITREDIFSEKLNFVFGLAGKGTCIISSARLDPRFYGAKPDAASGELFKDRLVKEVIHEIGHCMGLPHCKDKKCVMAHSNSVQDVDNKDSAFCERCKKVIKTYSG
jgi:archaemetzincin